MSDLDDVLSYHERTKYHIDRNARSLGYMDWRTHYAPFIHARELRAEVPVEQWNDLSSILPSSTFYVGWTSIPRRESWEYGERAFRYCQHDVGHALAALSVTEAMQGWACRVVEGLGDAALATLLGIAGQQGAEQRGAWFFRRLLWESGILGQMLYLEAEAAGLAGTGIGCFFDDAVHQVLGIRGEAFQSLYHFTVGGPVVDPRLRTTDAYEHLKA